MAGKSGPLLVIKAAEDDIEQSLSHDDQWPKELLEKLKAEDHPYMPINKLKEILSS